MSSSSYDPHSREEGYFRSKVDVTHRHMCNSVSVIRRLHDRSSWEIRECRCSVDLSLTVRLSVHPFVKRLITTATVCVGILFKIQPSPPPEEHKAACFSPSGLLFLKIMEIIPAFPFFFHF